MYFGIHVFGKHAPDRPPAANFQQCLEQVRAAREAGFDLLWCGHHYAVEEYQKFQVVPSLGRFAAEAGEMHVGSAFLLPLHQPLVVAEQFATLDAMTDGRVILAPVSGYRDVEFESMGVPKAERAGRLVEGVEVIKRLWTEDDVTYEGEYFSLDGVTINPKPVQEPRPPIWVGANADSAVRRASRLGDAWLVNPHADDATISRQLRIADRPSGRGFRGVQPGRREVFVAESDEAATRIYGNAIEEYYDWYEEEGQGDAMEDGEALDLALEKLQEDRFVIGSPETVAEEFVALHEDVGLDCVIAAVQMPGVPREAVLECIELMGSEVFPRVEAALS